MIVKLKAYDTVSPTGVEVNDEDPRMINCGGIKLAMMRENNFPFRDTFCVYRLDTGCPVDFMDYKTKELAEQAAFAALGFTKAKGD